MFRFLTTAALFLLVMGSYAQPSGGPRPRGAIAAPIDAGASLLLAGGVAYTVRRIQQRRRK